MNRLTVSAIAIAVVLFVAVIVVLIFWLRRPSPVPPAAPPAAMPTSAPAPPHATYPFEDEWEAQAPYPDDAPHIRRPSFYREASDTRTAVGTHLRHRDAFAFDDVEPFDSHDTSSSHQAGPTLQRNSGFSMFRPSVAAGSSPSSSGDAPIRCPHCSSTRIDTLNVARTAGSTIGSVAGATSGFAMALSGAEAGAVVGAVGGPLGAVFGGLTGAVLAGLLGSAAGNAAGSILGAAIDENMLDNYRCLSCGHTFGAQHG
jgi:DNA-directed RNA polymerase subunit RPC12/RpoP